MMKKIINSIKEIFIVNAVKQSALKCNYDNNYYGDQQCQKQKP